MSKRTFARSRIILARDEVRFHVSADHRSLKRSALLAGASALVLAGACVSRAQAASFNVTDQAGFDSAISTARSNNASDTINLTIPTSPSFTVIRTDGSYTLPGDGHGLDLNIAPANAPSGFNISTFAVNGGDTLTITDGTNITVAPSPVSLMRVNIGDSNGSGTVDMTGGTLTFVPHDATDSSQYSYMVVGRDGGAGTFNQSGGVVKVGATTLIGMDKATGTYTASGDALLGVATVSDPNQAGYFFVGYNQYTGEAAADTLGTLHITDNAQVTLNNYIRLHVGTGDDTVAGLVGGTGKILQDSAGSVVDFTGEEFQFGSLVTGGVGTYELDAGTLNLNPTTVFSSTPAQFGAYTGATGHFIQNGGVFDTNANVQFGYNGTGTYDLGGGSATFSNGMTIAANGGSIGTVTQTAGTLSLTGGKITFGSGTGTYSLNGGTLDVGVADPFTNGGTFNLGGGTLKAGTAFSASRNFTLTANTSTVDTNGNAVGLSGVIDGAGNLQKAGGGILTLSNTETYTGSTTVADGTLALTGTGSIADSAELALTLSGTKFDISGITPTGTSIKDLSGVSGSTVALDTKTLTFGTGNNTTFNGDFTGTTGGIEKDGTGTFTFGGTTDYTGSTLIADGTLKTTHADAFENTSSLTFDNGADWDLTGAGEQKLSGALAFSSGSQLSATLGDGHDQILSTSTVDLGGASLYVHGGDGNFSIASPYLLISSTGLTGTFSSYGDDLTFLDVTPDYVLNNVYLDFAKSSTTFASIGMTPNETSVGGALDGLDVGNPLFDEIATLSAPDALAAIDSMEGDIHASTKSVLTEAATYVADATEDHIRDALGGAGGAGADVTLTTAAAHPGGPGLWISGYGHSLALKDPSGNAADVSSTNGGLVAGLDFGSDGWIAGIGAGYDKASLNADSHMSSSDVDGYTALAYAGTRVGLVNFSVGGSYTGNAISSTRTVALPMTQTLTAGYNGSTTQAFGEVGLGMGGFEPFAGANYIGVATDGFTETGGTAAITAAASEQSVTFTTLGVRARLAAANGFWLSGMAGWRHAFGDVTPVMNGTIEAQAFAVDGAPIATDAFVAEAGIDAALGVNTTVGVSYLGQIGANAQDHGAKATATMRF